MSEKYNSVPVLLMVFKRPELTRKVLSQLRASKVKRLYISSEAPENCDSEGGVEEVRRIIVEEIDWNCRVDYNFREKNRGLREGVLAGIDWFFENESEGIILEDDCIPSAEFFGFCAVMLKKFRNHPEVMHVAGDNSASVKIPQDWSYCFIDYPHVWGWATWKRAWNLYDRDLVMWRKFASTRLVSSLFPFEDERKIWEPLLNRLWSDGVPDTWDWQWAITLKMHRGLSVQAIPNLVSNIGSGPLATHTRSLGERENVAPADIGQLRHPDFIFPHMEASRAVFLSTQTTLGVRPTLTPKATLVNFAKNLIRRFQS